METRQSKYHSIECQVILEEEQNPYNFTDQKSEGEPASKRKRFSFQEKKKILEECKVKSWKFIHKKYKINQRTLRKWKEKKDVIYNSAKNSNSANKKKVVQDTTELDDALHLWLLDALNKGIPITGKIVQRKALDLNEEMCRRSDFKASNGWLEGWKKRKNVRCLQIPGKVKTLARDIFKYCQKNISFFVGKIM